MSRCLATILALAAWSAAFEESPLIEPCMGGTMSPAESWFADGAGANVAIQRVPVASALFNATASSESVSAVTIEATIEPKWLDWTGILLICQGDQYRGQARVTDGQAFLRFGASGTIHPTETGLWLVTYRLEMQLGDGSQIKRVAAAGSAVCKEGERVKIVTIGGLSVLLQVWRTDANIKLEPPLQPSRDSRGSKHSFQALISSVLHDKRSSPRRE